MPKEPLYPHVPGKKEPQFPHTSKGRVERLMPNKEPWQMTRREFMESWIRPQAKLRGDTEAQIQKDIDMMVEPPLFGESHHKQLIETALSEGKPVPPEVLKDYPDLAKAEYLQSIDLLASTEGDPIRKFCCRQCGECAPKELLEEGKFPERIAWLRQHYEEKHPGMWGKMSPMTIVEDGELVSPEYRYLTGWVDEPLPD